MKVRRLGAVWRRIIISAGNYPESCTDRPTRRKPLLARRLLLLPLLTFLLLLFFLRRQRFRECVRCRGWHLRLRWGSARLGALAGRGCRRPRRRLVIVRLRLRAIVRLRLGRTICLWSISRHRWLRLHLWPSRFWPIVRRCRRRSICFRLIRSRLIVGPLRWICRWFRNRLSWLGGVRLVRRVGAWMAHGRSCRFARRRLFDHGMRRCSGRTQRLQFVFR